MSNTDKILKVAEQFYRDLYSSRDLGFSITPETPEEVEKALDSMQRDKAVGGAQVTADLLKDSGQIVLEKLATLNDLYVLDCAGVLEKY